MFFVVQGLNGPVYLSKAQVAAALNETESQIDERLAAADAKELKHE